MDYSVFSKTILKKVLAAMALINNPEIDPDIRQLNQEILFREVGQSVYEKIYDMNAFDYEIEFTRGPGVDDRHFGMAKIASASISAGALGLDEQVKNFLDQSIAQAQRDATVNARQSGKFPTVTRSTRGKTCNWCQNLAGTYNNPGPEVFKRHRGCDCEIKSEGYRSRNGLLDNYVKPSERNG